MVARVPNLCDGSGGKFGRRYVSGEIDINSWKMKRNYPCGATKRRKREEAKSKNDALPKLTTFFNVSTTPPVVEEQQEAPANSEGEAGNHSNRVMLEL